MNPTAYYLLWKPIRTITWLILYVWSTSKLKLNYRDQLDQVLYMMKTRQDNDVTDCISLAYTKIETELLRPIWTGTIYDEK